MHWACDRYGSSRTPFFGESFIEPFREHHRDPQAITGKSFVEVNGNTAIALFPFLILTQHSLPVEESRDAPFWHVFMMGLCAWLIVTNYFHKPAHAAYADRGRVVRWLQGKRFILSESHHERHHLAPFDRHYCITSGRLDPLLQGVRLWARLQSGIDRVSGMGRQIRASTRRTSS